jgi:hypothetical protein
MSSDETSNMTGEVREQITYDYILDLYQQYKEMNLSDEEMKKRVAVLEAFADNIGDYLIITHK